MNCEVNPDILPAPAEIEEPKEGICPVDWALKNARLAKRHNCGRSVMCSDGMTQLELILTDITTGRGRADDIALTRELCEAVQSTEKCEFSRRTSSNVILSMDRYPDEWDQHCRRKRCNSLICPDYYSVYIDPLVCTGCGECTKIAPQGAIAGGEGLIHIIMDDAGLKEESFFECCPASAIKKAGAVKPKLPDSPIPAGSFEGSASNSRRRRRRAT